MCTIHSAWPTQVWILRRQLQLHDGLGGSSQWIPLIDLHTAETFVPLTRCSQTTKDHCSLGEVGILFILTQVEDSYQPDLYALNRYKFVFSGIFFLPFIPSLRSLHLCVFLCEFSVTVSSVVSGVRCPGFKCWPFHLLSVWPWVTYLTVKTSVYWSSHYNGNENSAYLIDLFRWNEWVLIKTLLSDAE